MEEPVMPPEPFSEKIFKNEIRRAVMGGRTVDFKAKLLHAEAMVGRPKVQDLLNEYYGRFSLKPLLLLATEEPNLEICELLIHEYKVLLETPGLSIKGERNIQPLAAAVRKELSEFVRLFVEAGAKVNVVNSRIRKNPLREACRVGSSEMVELLMSLGADIEIANRAITSCLCLAIHGDHVETVKCLLKFGEHPDKTSDEPSPLELASSRGVVAIIEELVKYGADLRKQNQYGQLPIMIAAKEGHVNAVEYFLTFEIYSREERIAALELLGASNLSTEINIKYLEKALVERSNNPILCKPRNVPVQAYDFHIECQNLEEFESIKNDHVALLNECQVIRERLLPLTDVANIEHIHHLVLEVEGKYTTKKKIKLLMRVLTLFGQTHLKETDKIRCDLCSSFQRMILADDDDIPIDSFCEFLEMTVKLYSLHKGVNRETRRILEQISEKYLWLTFLAARLLSEDSRISHEFKKRIYRAVGQLVRTNILHDRDCTLLHSAVATRVFKDGRVYPDFRTVRLMVDCGFDVNAKDFKGKTALHSLLIEELFEASDNAVEPSEIKSIISLFSEAGAHLEGTDYVGQKAFERADPLKSRLLCSIIPDKTLKYLAARAVDLHAPEQVNRLPENLRTFIEHHSSKQVFVDKFRNPEMIGFALFI